MSLDTDTLIAEVARRWGIIITRDDPIIAVVALNDAVLEQHTDRLEKANKALETHLKKVISTQVDQSRQIAKIVIGEALRHASHEINAEADKAIKAIAQAHLENKADLGVGLKQREALQRSATIGWTMAALASVGMLVLLIWFT